MHTLAYILILASATIHASWNTMARHIKGNTPVLVIAHFIGSLMVFPFIFTQPHNIYAINMNYAIPILFLSILAHGAYVMLLSSAYVHGDVGVVYPLARGTAILLATIMSQILEIDKRLGSLAVIGILIVLSGICLLCYEAIVKAVHLPKPDIGTRHDVHPDIVDEISKSDWGTADGLSLMGSTIRSDDADINVATTTVVNRKTESGLCEGEYGNYSTTNSECDNVSEVQSRLSLNVVLSSDWFAVRSKLLISLGLAMGVGACTATYSIVDALGVRAVPFIIWAFSYNFISNLCLMPFLYYYYYDDTMIALKEHKRSCILIAPCVVGAYFIILVVFTMPGSDVALVVTLREFAVLIGALFGVVFLKERYSNTKFVAIIVMLTGMVVLKFA